MDVDTLGNPCQYDIITAPVPQFGTEMPCASHCETSGEIKFTHGGSRPGAGRPRKPQPIAPAVYDLRWFCVRTEYKAENAADHAIRTAGFTTLLPLLCIPPVAARHTEAGRAIPATSSRLVPLLSSYLFVQFNAHDPSWRHIATMRGVSCIISAAPERPIPIPDAQIDYLRASLDPNGCKYPDSDAEQEVVDKVKKRWVAMLDGLAGLATALQMEAV